ncbi:ribonuclease H [Clostridia bacterium]|nr:ribonuclease H [Clostridia bacterium]
MDKVEIFSDGACKGNPGKGGWGALLRWRGSSGKVIEKELCGGERATTNNRMELTAVIESLRLLKRPCEVVVTTDSRYVVDSVTKRWVYNWQRQGWVKTSGSGASVCKKPVPNADLWRELLPLLETHKVTFNWVRGHAGHAENERCDTLASEYALSL